MGMIGRYQQKNMTACVETQNSFFFFILVINLRKEAYLMFCHYVENLKKKLLHVYQKDAINHSANERRQRSPQVLVH